MPTFDSWDCTPPVLPPRSRLYALEPLGIRTPFVESLSGYIARLADAHAVSVGDLVGRELAPSIAKPLTSVGPSMRQSRANSHGFRAGAYTINGFGKHSKKWIEALATATLQKGLRFLTLSPFDGVFAPQGVSRKTRMWCPNCYDEWQMSGTSIYEPLLWNIGLAPLCRRHLVPLAGECPHCGRRSKTLAVYSRPGYCSHCQQWLGGSATGSLESGPDDPRAHDAALARTEAIGELLAIAPRLEGVSLHGVFTANLKACVDAITDGNMDAFARRCQVTRAPLHFYLSGSHMPTLNFVLRISYRLSVPLVAFLENDPLRADAYWKQTREALGDRHVPARRSKQQMRLELLKAAQKEKAPSLSEIARQLGYKGTNQLHQADPGLCKQIIARYRQSGRSHLWKKPNGDRICERVDLRRLLEQCLAQDGPVSIRGLAASVGYASASCLQQKFPDLCRAIGNKIAARRAERLVDMERVLTEALKEDPATTLTDLRKRLGYSSSSALRQHFPELCQQILARRQTARQEKIAQAKRKLQGILSEVPVVSLRIASKRMGISCAYLYELCPEECAAVTSRYRRCRHEAAELRKINLLEEVRRLVRQLHDQGKCPSAERVTSLLSPDSSKEWKAVNATVKAARQEIENERPRQSGRAQSTIGSSEMTADPRWREDWEA
jgi:transcriptional regulator with XRE-family HTH domain